MAPEVTSQRTIRHSHELMVEGHAHWISHAHPIDVGEFGHDHVFTVTGATRISGLGLTKLEAERRRAVEAPRG
jgi:hypothetical protein